MKTRLNLLISTGIALVLAVLLFTSCSQGPKHLSAIPDDAIAVMSVDFPALSKKVDLNELSSLNLLKGMMQGMQTEDAMMATYLEEIMNDPSKTGLNLNRDLLLFFFGDINNLRGGFTAELSSSKKFEEFLGDLATKVGLPIKIESVSGVSIASIEGTPVFGWDNDKLVVAFSDRGPQVDNVTALLKLESGKQITNNKAFNDFYAKKKDLSFWMNFDFASKSREMQEVMADLPYSMEGSYMEFFMAFENKKVVTSGVFVPNEELKKIYSEYNMIGKMDERLLKYLPKESLFVFSGASNMAESSRFIEANPKYAEMFKDLDRELGFSFTELLKELKGNVVASLHGVDDQFDMLPLFSVVVDLNNKALIENLLALVPAETMVKEGHYYTIQTGMFPLFLAVDDKTALLTSDWNVIDAFKDGGLKENFTASPLKKNIMQNVSYLHICLNYEQYPNALKQMVGSNYMVIKPFDDLFDSIEMVGTSNSNVEFVLNTENKEGNSLQAILKAVDSALLPFMMNQMR